MNTSRAGVQLTSGHAASEILHSVLAEAIEAFPGDLGAATLPHSVKVFRADYPKLLPEFEALRLASNERSAIARFMANAIQSRLVWQNPTGEVPLANDLRSRAGTPLPLERVDPGQDPGWRPQLDYRGEKFYGPQLAHMGEALSRRHIISRSAADSLRWVQESVLRGGTINLQDRKVVIFGAAAEMAPTAQLSAAGADILWLDVAPPTAEWLNGVQPAGRIYWPTQGVDLLTSPHDVLATIVTFAGGRSVDLGLYAYAPGQARELRLTGVMNAIVNALPAELIASVSLLVSPTTPTEMDADDIIAMDQRHALRPVWQRLLSGLHLLSGTGRAQVPGGAATCSVVKIQGTSYQAAQYLGKVMMAETWANFGQLNAADPRPLRISANTAAITRTRSLEHPVFNAAFGGASAFDVETFSPTLSRELNGLLMVRDLLDDRLPVPARVRVHGGIHALPCSLESALRIAALIGFLRPGRSADAGP